MTQAKCDPFVKCDTHLRGASEYRFQSFSVNIEVQIHFPSQKVSLIQEDLILSKSMLWNHTQDDGQGNQSHQTSITCVPTEVANNVTEFIFLGFSQDPGVQLMFFALFLLFYIVIMVGNLLILLTVFSDPRLHTPMYFFLSSNLSFVDIAYSSATAPKMIADFVSEKKTISYWGCVTHMFTFHFFGCAEIFVLTVMAFDRYVAICHSLRYTTIMSANTCIVLASLSWLGALGHSFFQILLTFQLPFCNYQVIDHYFCDVHPVLKLACADTTLVNMLVIANSGLISLGCFLILLASYIVILFSLRKRSSESRRKALSTCGSHFTVVTFLFVPCIFIYLRPSTTFPLDKAVSVFYTTITPMLNPLIYTLRNEDVKNAMKRIWSRKVSLKEKQKG
uniref:LOW QUALITY PROTEIN: olfactory receptor 4S2-like n=1 Tax=Odobenus rosmarus divergens TaxID=9708 RepID=UPI00063C5C4F|nr:PREDICTED: LOW QUALITY PROTEIN: olfactory receptor 4S2-like [Odobenus rosmarus divergens]